MCRYFDTVAPTESGTLVKDFMSSLASGVVLLKGVHLELKKRIITKIHSFSAADDTLDEKAAQASNGVVMRAISHMAAWPCARDDALHFAVTYLQRVCGFRIS